jgi:hypothetical protein
MLRCPACLSPSGPEEPRHSYACEPDVFASAPSVSCSFARGLCCALRCQACSLDEQRKGFGRSEPPQRGAPAAAHVSAALRRLARAGGRCGAKTTSSLRAATLPPLHHAVSLAQHVRTRHLSFSPPERRAASRHVLQRPTLLLLCAANAHRRRRRRRSARGPAGVRCFQPRHCSRRGRQGKAIELLGAHAAERRWKD